MSRNKPAFGAHFPPSWQGRLSYSRKVMKASNTSVPCFPRPSERVSRDLGFDTLQWVAAGLGSLVWMGLCLLAFWIWPVHAMAQVPQAAPSNDGMQAQVEALLKEASARAAGGGADGAAPWRVEIELGQLNPRLKLAPCEKVRAYMPDGAQMWGRTRVGLRCEQGPVRWNVYWPVTVKVWGQGLVASRPLRPGEPIQASDLHMAEVDVAAQGSPALVHAEPLIGRFVAKAVQAGESLREDDIKARRWFSAGDMVRLTVRGKGFQVASEGTALVHGDEGRCARIRTESGRVVCALPTGERQVELSL